MNIFDVIQDINVHQIYSNTDARMTSIKGTPPSIRKQKEVAERVLEYLRGLNRTNVYIGDLESRFDFNWNSFLYQDETQSIPFNLHSDPFYAEIMCSEMAQSIDAFFHALPHYLCSLPGLHPSQNTFLLRQQLQYLTNLLSSCLTPVLCGAKEMTGENVLETLLDDCEKRTSKVCIDSLKKLFQQQAFALRALRNIHTLVEKDAQFTQMLVQHSDEFNSLTTYPPPALMRMLDRNRCSFHELQEYITSGNRSNVKGASGLEPSGAAREGGLLTWIKHNEHVLMSDEYTQIVQQLESASALHTESDRWHGLRIYTDKLETVGEPFKIRMIQLDHACDVDSLWVASSLTCFSGAQHENIECNLLVTRVVHVIRHLVRSKLMGIKLVRSDWLVAYLSRCQVNCQLSPCMQIEPEEKQTSNANEEGDQAKNNIGQEQLDVSMCLQRDHALCIQLKLALEEEKQIPLDVTFGIYIIHIKTIAQRVLLHASHIRSGSTSVAIQWICNLIAKLGIHIPNLFDFYKRDMKWTYGNIPKPACSCIVGERKDLKDVVNKMDEFIKLMQQDRTFSDKWFSSRFAKHRCKKQRLEKVHGSHASFSEN